MNHNHTPSDKKYERTIVSTLGETIDWLENKATGDSVETSTYLVGLTLIRAETVKSGNEDAVRAIDLLTGQIGTVTESRHDKAARENGGVLPAGLDGIVTPHEVSMADIEAAVDRFAPQHPEDQGPQDATNVLSLHVSMMQFIDDQPKPDGAQY